MNRSILIINYEYPPIGAGAANATYYIAQAFVKMGIRTSVLTASFQDLTGYQNDNGVAIYRIKSIRKKQNESNILEMCAFTFSALFSLPQIIKKVHPSECLIFFGFPCGPIGLILRFIFQIPYIISLRGGDVPGAEKGLNVIHLFLTPLRRFIYKNSGAVVANSCGLKELSESKDPFPITVIPNGVDADYYKPGTDKKDESTIKILFAGRFRSQKNLFFLIDTLKKVFEQNGNIELHMVGDGPDTGALKSYCSKISFPIIWYGWLTKDKMLEVYKQCHLFVNPSLYEGMPNTVLEAMACGLPVIASDVAGNKDIVIDRTTGLLYNKDDQNALIDAVNTYLTNKTLLAAHGSEARARVESEYSWCSVAKEYSNLIPAIKHNAI